MQIRKKTSKMTAVLLAAAVTLSAAVSLKDWNAAPVAAAEDTVKILVVGDSITDGFINGDNGYRKYFCYDLQQNGITNFDMVGPNNAWSNEATYDWNGTTITYDPQHAGYSGFAIQNIGNRTGIQETIFNSTYTDGDRSGNMLEAYDPDIIMLQIGTNDILDAQLEKADARLEELVDKILPYVSETGKVLYLASIPDIDVSLRYDWLGNYQYIKGGVSYAEDPVTFTANVQKALDDYNTIVKNLVAKKQAEGAHIQFSDINRVIDITAGDLKDGVHPNEQGYAKMGQHWANLLTETYFNGTVDPPVTTATTTATTTTTMETTASTTTEGSAETTTTSQTTTTTPTQTTQSGGGSDVTLTDVAFGTEIDISAYQDIASIDIVIQKRPEYGMNGNLWFDSYSEPTDFSLDDFDGTVLTVTPSKDYSTMTINQYYGGTTLEKVVIHLKGGVVTTDSTTEGTTTTTKTTEQTTTTTVTTVTTEETLPVGDVNGDGETDLTDLVLLQKYLVRRGTLTEEQAKRADLNADNRLNVVDAILLRRLLLQKG